jgi:hypothetical protein
MRLSIHNAMQTQFLSYFPQISNPRAYTNRFIQCIQPISSSGKLNISSNDIKVRRIPRNYRISPAVRAFSEIKFFHTIGLGEWCGSRGRTRINIKYQKPSPTNQHAIIKWCVTKSHRDLRVAARMQWLCAAPPRKYSLNSSALLSWDHKHTYAYINVVQPPAHLRMHMFVCDVIIIVPHIVAPSRSAVYYQFTSAAGISCNEGRRVCVKAYSRHTDVI